MAEKFRPGFLHSDVNVGPLFKGDYAKGYFTIVGNLENLPGSVKEKVPNGYVIKEYQYTVDVGDASKESARYIEVAKEFQHKYVLMKNYFAKSLPELVVPTQIIVGEDEKTKKKHLYEIQPRLDESSTAHLAKPNNRSMENFYGHYIRGIWRYDQSKAEKDLENFVAYIKNQFPDKIDLFKHEISVFIKEISDFPSKEKHIPFDCAWPTNLIFTEQGLRLIDTNAVLSISNLKAEDNVFGENRMKEFEFLFNNSLKLLELIESKL